MHFLSYKGILQQLSVLRVVWKMLENSFVGKNEIIKSKKRLYFYPEFLPWPAPPQNLERALLDFKERRKVGLVETCGRSLGLAAVHWDPPT